MYLYIYDNFLTAKKHQGLLYKIENRLVDLGIKGRVVRLNILKNMEEVVDDGIKQGVKTVVVVGNDKSFSKIINIIAQRDVVLGIIPVDKKSKIANILGVPYGSLACEVLAQRIIKKIDLGLVNNYYFIDSAVIENEPTLIKFGTYNISPTEEDNRVSFNNLGYLTHNDDEYKFNPTDGKLEAVIETHTNSITKSKQASVFPFKDINVEVEKPGAFIIADQVAKLKPPTTISVAPNKLRVIVGSDRKFK